MYIVKITFDETWYVKDTCHCGAFYGRLVLTTDRDRARKWTHKKHADALGHMVVYHLQTSSLHDQPCYQKYKAIAEAICNKTASIVTEMI